MKYKIAADTSALISLGLSGLLKKSFKYFSFLIGPIVKEELEEIAKVKDNLGETARYILFLVKTGKISVVKIQKADKGEDEALEIMKNFTCDFLISDDIDFVKKVDKTIVVQFSVFVIFILYNLGEISKEEAKNAIERVFKEREWTENLISLYAGFLLQ